MFFRIGLRNPDFKVSIRFPILELMHISLEDWIIYVLGFHLYCNSLHAKMAVSDSQGYPSTLYLINNGKIFYFFLDWFLKNISFLNYKQWYLIHTWFDNATKGTVVNRALPWLNKGSLETTVTVLLSRYFSEQINTSFELN